MRTGRKFCSKKARAVLPSCGRTPLALRQTFHRAPEISPSWSVRRILRELAACLIGRERGAVIIGSPARQLGPFDRLELAAWEFQRLLAGPFFGRYGAGRQT